LQRIPFLLVVGAREAASGQVALRRRDGEDLGVLTLEQARQYLLDAVQAPDLAARQAEQAALQHQLSTIGANASTPAPAAEGGK